MDKGAARPAATLQDGRSHPRSDPERREPRSRSRQRLRLRLADEPHWDASGDLRYRRNSPLEQDRSLLGHPPPFPLSDDPSPRPRVAMSTSVRRSARVWNMVCRRSKYDYRTRHMSRPAPYHLSPPACSQRSTECSPAAWQREVVRTRPGSRPSHSDGIGNHYPEPRVAHPSTLHVAHAAGALPSRRVQEREGRREEERGEKAASTPI